VASFLSPQLKRLLGYLRPYALRFGLGVILVAFVAMAEGAVALMIKLAVDFVLIRPSAVRDCRLGLCRGTGECFTSMTISPHAFSMCGVFLLFP